jgi:hypothetical protein
VGPPIKAKENKYVDKFKALGYSGTMDIKKAIDQAYLRGQVVALYKLKVNMQDTINKLEDQIKEGENDRDKL